MSHFQCSRFSSADPGASCFAALALAPGYLISRLRRWAGCRLADTGLEIQLRFELESTAVQ